MGNSERRFVNIFSMRHSEDLGRTLIEPARTSEGMFLHFSSHEDLFESLVSGDFGDLVSPRYDGNLFYTADEYFEPGIRSKSSLSMNVGFWLDIDNVNYAHTEGIIRVVSGITDVDESDMVVVRTGHGLQFFIKRQIYIQYNSGDHYYGRTRLAYGSLCNSLDLRLNDHGFKTDQTKVDISVWSANRLLRVPFGLNRKVGYADVETGLIRSTLNAEGASSKIAGICKPNVVTSLKKAETSLQEKLYRNLDESAILANCGAMRRLKETRGNVSEPEWYAGLGFVSRFPDWGVKIHEYSDGHPKYDRDETIRKANHAISSAGPRTCESMSGLFKECEGCPNRTTSPAVFRFAKPLDERTDELRKNRYHEKRGKQWSPNYVLFAKDAKERFNLRVCEGGVIYRYDDETHIWKRMDKNEAKSFCTEEFTKVEDYDFEYISKFSLAWNHSRLMNAFRALQDSIDDEDRYASSEMKNSNRILFRNGVFDFNTNEFHTLESIDVKRMYFVSRCEIFYNADADRTMIEDVLDNLFAGSISRKKNFLRFCYYILNQDVKAQKCLFLYGATGSGKSTLMRLFKYLLPDERSTAFDLVDLVGLNSENPRYFLKNSRVNIQDELGPKDLTQRGANEFFKKMVTGGEIQGRLKTYDVVSFELKTKFVFGMNTLPTVLDKGGAVFRRILAINTPNSIAESDMDHNFIDKLRVNLPAFFNMIIEEGLLALSEKGDGKFSWSEDDEWYAEDREDAESYGEDIIDEFIDDCLGGMSLDYSWNKKYYNSVVFKKFQDWHEGKYKKVPTMRQHNFSKQFGVKIRLNVKDPHIFRSMKYRNNLNRGWQYLRIGNKDALPESMYWGEDEEGGAS